MARAKALEIIRQPEPDGKPRGIRRSPSTLKRTPASVPVRFLRAGLRQVRSAHRATWRPGLHRHRPAVASVGGAKIWANSASAASAAGSCSLPDASAQNTTVASPMPRRSRFARPRPTWRSAPRRSVPPLLRSRRVGALFPAVDSERVEIERNQRRARTLRPIHPLISGWSRCGAARTPVIRQVSASSPGAAASDEQALWRPARS